MKKQIKIESSGQSGSMISLILATMSKYIVPFMLLFSFFLLLRGHNEPGGGFVGGLVAASAYILYALANDIKKARIFLGIEPILLVATGLMLSLFSGMVGWLFGEVFLTGIWSEIKLPIIGKIGSPFFFDLGVFLVVMGITVKIIFTLLEEVLDK